MTGPDSGLADPDEPHVVQSASTSSAAGQENVVDLLRQLVGQGSHLAEQQLSLIKAEIREATTDIKVAAGGLAGAAVVGIAGLGVTLMGLAYLLGEAIDNVALATLIVGVATLVVAFILYSAGSKKMRGAHLAPDRTVRTLERTPDAARGNLTTEPRP